MVVEFDLADPITAIDTRLPEDLDHEIRSWLKTTHCFIAARPPEELDHEIKNVQSHWMKAQKNLTDEEILESLPKVYPSEKYMVNKAAFPGVGKFPVDEWIKDNRPMLDSAGWIALAMKIAAKDMQNLAGIFALAVSLEEEEHRQAQLERDLAWATL